MEQLLHSDMMAIWLCRALWDVLDSHLSPPVCCTDCDPWNG